MGPAPGALQYLYNSKSGQACKAEHRPLYHAHNPSPNQGYMHPPLPICCPPTSNTNTLQQLSKLTPISTTLTRNRNSSVAFSGLTGSLALGTSFSKKKPTLSVELKIINTLQGQNGAERCYINWKIQSTVTSFKRSPCSRP